jgi:hypothetical protein
MRIPLSILDLAPIAPGETAVFDVVLRHSGPVGTIRSELRWID